MILSIIRYLLCPLNHMYRTVYFLMLHLNRYYCILYYYLKKRQSNLHYANIQQLTWIKCPIQIVITCLVIKFVVVLIFYQRVCFWKFLALIKLNESVLTDYEPVTEKSSKFSSCSCFSRKRSQMKISFFCSFSVCSCRKLANHNLKVASDRSQSFLNETTLFKSWTQLWHIFSGRPSPFVT